MTAKVKAIKNLYVHGKVNKEDVFNSVPNVITEKEYNEITGYTYPNKE